MVNFKVKLIRRDKEGHCILVKRIIQEEEEITLMNIYVPNTGGPIFIKQIVLNIKDQINTNPSPGEVEAEGS